MTAPGLRTSAPAAGQRLRLLRQRWPAAARLARLLSLAVRIEPSLLRAARLAAGLDAVAEADLWFSGIIAGSGTLGISFVPAVAEALRRELAASPDERALAWKLTNEHHGQQPWSIRLEERINFLTTGPPTEAPEIEDLLAAALSELREVRARDEQAALGIARWLLAALARAPAAARATPTAAAAEVAAGVHLDGRLGGADQLAQAENSDLLPWLLDHLGTTVLPVRLMAGAVALGGAPPDGIPLPVPVTNPLVVSIAWGSGSGAHYEHVRVTQGEELIVPVEASEVELRTLAGGGVVLRRAGIGRIVVDGVDRGAGFAVADHAILTAAHVLGDWALRLARPSDPTGLFASEPPASEAANSAGGSRDDLRGSGPVPKVTYLPEGGELLDARVVATDAELDVALLEPGRPVPAILPVAQIQPGQQWRLQVPPGRDQAGSRQSADVPAASFRGVTTAGYPRPRFALTEGAGSLRSQSGAAITLENPRGAVIGLLVGEETELQSPESMAPARPQRLLRVVAIDAIVASFSLTRHITPATAAPVDGKWPGTQPLESLLAIPLRDGSLPVLADVEPAELGFPPAPPARLTTSTLRRALEAGAFVLVAGTAYAPSSAAYPAVRAELPAAGLLIPNARTGTFMALATHPDLVTRQEQVVVWLDDLPRYLNQAGDLDPLLSRFRAQNHLTALIATISQADLDRLRSDPLRPVPIQRLLDQAVVISLAEDGAPAWSGFRGTSQLVGSTADGIVTVYVDPNLGPQGLQNAQDLLVDARRVVAANNAIFGTAGGAVNVIVHAIGGATDGTGGAYHMGCNYQTGNNIEVCAAFGHSVRVSALFESQLSECSMNGRLCALSTGEALSRWCASSTSNNNNALADYVTAPNWAQAGTPDWVNNVEPTDQNAVSTGCGMAFISWLLSKGYTLAQIAQQMVANGDVGTFADLYGALTGDNPADAWPSFLNDVNGLPSGVNSDNPFG